MTIYKICYRFLSSPIEDTEIHEVVAPEGSQTFEHAIEPVVEGNYLVEYWAVDDTGKESEKQSSRLVVKPFSQPQSCKGGTFVSDVASGNAMEVQFNQANVSLRFARTADGMGYAFDWSDLDLRGLQLEQNRLGIPAGTWLYQHMLRNRASFMASFSGAKKQLFVVSGSQEYLVSESSPALVSKLVDKVYFENGKLSFRVLRPATFIWK